MTHMSKAQVAGALATIAVTAAVVAGIFVLGSPAEERSRRLDERRVQDLSGIARAVDLYWTRNNASFPASLETLRNDTGARISITDPGTDAPYEFRRLEGSEYELCAVFEGESAESARGVEVFWSHRAGRQCFKRAAEAVR
jgi:hypothetical protein